MMDLWPNKWTVDEETGEVSAEFVELAPAGWDPMAPWVPTKTVTLVIGVGTIENVPEPEQLPNDDDQVG